MDLLRILNFYILIFQCTGRGQIFTTPGPVCNYTQEVNNSNIIWDKSLNDNNTLYYSTPLCIRSGIYVLRKCDEGKFTDDDPKCDTLQSHDYACMEGLQLEFTSDGEAFCYTKSENKVNFYGTKSFKCPYKTVDAIDRMKFYFALSGKFPIWLRYHREMKNYGFGNFISDWIHGISFKPWLVGPRPGTECLAVEEEILSSNCDVPKYHVCIYRAFHLDLNLEEAVVSKEVQFCEDRGDRCRISWNHFLGCICVEKVCNRSVMYPVAPESVAVDVFYNKFALQWTHGGELVGNTLWSVRDLKEFDKSNMNPLVWSKNGWSQYPNMASSQICELEFKSDIPGLKLTFDKQTRKHQLTVTFDESLFCSMDELNNTYYIMCFQELGFYVGPYERDNFPNFSGSWLCEGIDLNDSSKKVRSNTVLMQFNDLVYILQMIENEDLTNIGHVQYYIYQSIPKGLPNPNITIVSYRKIFEQNQTVFVDTLYRIEFISDKDLSLQHKSIYDNLKKTLTNPVLTQYTPEIYNLKYCDEIKTTQDEHELIWPLTNAKKAARTNCFDNDYHRLEITCDEDFNLGARFSKIPKCVKFEGKLNEELSNLENSTAGAEEVLNNLASILDDATMLTPEELEKSVNILEKYQDDDDCDVDDVLKVVSTLMEKDRKVLSASQHVDNVTDRALYSLDVSLASLTISEHKNQELRTSNNIESFLIDLKKSEYFGLAHLNTGEIEFLQKGMTLDEIRSLENFESAAIINNSDGSGVSSITMFKKPNLFNDNMNQKTFDIVFGVLLPVNTSNIGVVLIFPNSSGQCAFWEYGDEKYGQWNVENYNKTINNSIVCMYNHTTHYGYLISAGMDFGVIFDMILSTMTMIECTLSVFGLTAILCTAFAFPQWGRKNTRLLHYCTVLLVQIILLFVNSNVSMVDWLCATTGAILHFTVLVQFCWMAITALQRHRAFVMVFQTKKAFWETNWVMLFVYLPPFIIVGLAVSLKWEDYLVGDEDWAICYPHGDILLFALIIPMACIVSFNGFIFIWIVYELNCRQSPVLSSKSSLQRKLDILRAIAVMCFTMGITWWPAIGALLLDSVFLVYVFSIFTALQGFVIFVFLIVTSEEVRGMIRRKYYSKSWNVWKK